MALPITLGTNCWTQAEDKLAEELAECSSLQSFLGVGTAETAKAGNMYIDSIGRAPEEFSEAQWIAKFPNVILGSPGQDADVFTLTNRSSGPDFGATGLVEVSFAVLLNENTSETEQERQFKNDVGDILIELTDRPLDIPSIAVQEYGRNPESDHERMGVILSCLTYVRWGTLQESD